MKIYRFRITRMGGAKPFTKSLKSSSVMKAWMRVAKKYGEEFRSDLKRITFLGSKGSE